MYKFFYTKNFGANFAIKFKKKLVALTQIWLHVEPILNQYGTRCEPIFDQVVTKIGII